MMKSIYTATALPKYIYALRGTQTNLSLYQEFSQLTHNYGMLL